MGPWQNANDGTFTVKDLPSLKRCSITHISSEHPQGVQNRHVAVGPVIDSSDTHAKW